VDALPDDTNELWVTDGSM